MTLKSKIIALITPIITLPLILLGLTAYAYFNKYSEEGSRRQLEHLESQIAQNARAYVRHAASDLKLLSHLVGKQLSDPNIGDEAINEMLRAFQHNFETFYEIELLDAYKRRTHRATYALPTPVKNRELLAGAHALAQHTHDITPDAQLFSEFSVKLITDTDTAHGSAFEFQARIAPPGTSQHTRKTQDDQDEQPLAYLRVKMHVDFLKDLEATTRIRDFGGIFFLKKDETLLFPREALITLPEVSEIWQRSERGRIGIHEWQDQNHLVAVHPIFPDLYLAAYLPEKEVYATVRQLCLVINAIIIAMILITVYVLYYQLERAFLVPLLELKHFTENIGEHDLQKGMDLERQDEFGDLAQSFKDMISRLDKSQQKIRHLAFFDELTGLPNRTSLRKAISLNINEAKRSEGTFAMLFLDMDDFKDINDRFGHTVGDGLLKTVSQRLNSSIRNTDYFTHNQIASDGDDKRIIARIGGDEFTIILNQFNSARDVSIVAQRILDSMAEPFFVNSREVFLSSSIGIAMYPIDGTTSEDLLKHCDIAMHEAKKKGKNNYKFFTDGLNKTVSERLELEADLRRAVNHQEFSLHYQPIVKQEDENVYCVEALIRWEHPKHGIISPSRFIPVTEETGLIRELGQWIINMACQQLSHWLDQGLKHLCMSINLSAVQLLDDTLPRQIQHALSTYDIEASRLQVEITETSFVKNETQSLETLHRLRDLGIHIALDDFGTGYSSLSYLRNLPIDTLKIDRSFITDLNETENNAQAIIKAIIQLANEMNLKTVAEGIENESQLHALKEMGCHEVQGYVYMRPTTNEELTRYLLVHRP